MIKSEHGKQITPELADQWLKTSTTNRKITGAKVAQYAASMRAGKWLLNGEPIIFDAQGHLMNGHHRMLACISAGVPFRSDVRAEIQRDAFVSHDTGRSRAPQDVLSMAGHKNTSILSGVLRGIEYITVSPVAAKLYYNNARALELLNEYPEALEWTNAYCGVKPATRILSAAFVSVCIVAARRHGTPIAESFFSAATRGNNLPEGSPIAALRDRMINMPRGQHYSTDTRIALYIMAWNAYYSGKKVKFLRWNTNQAFPELQ